MVPNLLLYFLPQRKGKPFLLFEIVPASLLSYVLEGASRTPFSIAGSSGAQYHDALTHDVDLPPKSLSAGTKLTPHPASKLAQPHKLGVCDAVDDDADALIADELVCHLLDGADDLGPLLALVGDQNQMGDLLHHAALNLLFDAVS